MTTRSSRTGSRPAGDADAPLLASAGRWHALGYALLAALAYVPILRTAPGRVVADTKSYLYLDPGRLLQRAPSMWDPDIGLGTVTHQNIGYLFPMGPYYWAMHALGVPAWVSQRIWLGTILLAAGLGVLFLLRTLRVRGPGAVSAALVFMLTPYLLDFASRLSVILLPWAGLPWLLAFVIRALRDPKGWRYPALFAITVQVVGSVNATALVFAGIAPVLWIVFAVVLRDVDWRSALRVTLKVGLLGILTSLWWIAGLWAQGTYGLDILKYTETLQTVSQASTATEVARGLGYWFFYGIDKIGPWIEASVSYTQRLGIIATSFAIVGLALAAAAFVRWRHRAYFVVLVLVGMVVAVGANPYDDPTVVGGVFRSFARSSDFGLALRSTSRAVPLVVLGLAVLLGTGINVVSHAWMDRGYRWHGAVVAGLVGVLAIANLPALRDGNLYGANLLRDEEVPSYWREAIAALDRGSHDTRILEIPGADFAAYRWGQTVDPITPGLTDRPYVARELVPWGTAGSANLLDALDHRMQEGTLDPAALAPIARLMNAGDVVYRADLETDRFDLVRARPLWLLLTKPGIPPGLAAPTGYGSSLGRPLTFAQLDEIALTLPPDAEDPPPVSVFPVRDAPKIAGTRVAASPLVVSGDGEGLVDLAPLGALDGRLVLYSASFARDAKGLRAAASQPDSLLVVTDSNRKRGQRWGSLKDIFGATERAGESALTRDERDSRLDLFPGAGLDAFTIVQTPGVAVSTTRYGNNDTYAPEQRGDRALDGDLNTAWQVGERTTVIGERIRIDVARPITTDHVNLVQPRVGRNDRYITRVKLTFDGRDPVTVDLGAGSRTPAGQTVTFPRHRFSRLELTIEDTNVGDSAAFPFSNGVGFAEIRVRDDRPGASDVTADETVRMPTDLVGRVGAAASEHPLVYSMSRSRTTVVPPHYSADELALARMFQVPDTRQFAVRGTVRLAATAPDDVLDRVLGIAPAGDGGLTVRASEHLPGDVRARGSSALDGDPTTAWTTAFGTPVGQWLEVSARAPVTLDHLDLQVVADGRHSVPTRLRIQSGSDARVVTVPPVVDRPGTGSVVRVPVRFAPLTGTTFRITVAAVRETRTVDYHDAQPTVMPVAIAELGAAGLARPPEPADLPGACRTDLVTVDGMAVGVRLRGTTADAEAGRPLDLEPCDPAGAATSAPLTLERGDHTLRTARGDRTGIDVDGFVLASSAGGGPMTLGPRATLPSSVAQPASGPGATPSVRVTDDGRTRLRLHVEGARPGRPFWLVLGESQSPGWRATVAGRDRGGSTLVDGFANGWLVRPGSASFDVTLEWTPQQRVWAALAMSALALLACLVLALVGPRRRALLVPSRDEDEVPRLGHPLVAAGGAPSWPVAVAAALAVAVVGALGARWWVGLIAGTLTLLVARRARWRALLTVGAPASLAVAAAYVLLQQRRYRWVSDLDWPGRFRRVSDLVWLAVLLLVADAVVSSIRRVRRRGATRR